MQHDPNIIFECDNCSDTIEVEMEYRYRSYNGNSGYYDHSGATEQLDDEGWKVGEDNKHFCCEECEEEYNNDN
tara:strand:+ start:252 stop:470 length:219 start_codon:yes stop_codon:yes gene_type:complete